LSKQKKTAETLMLDLLLRFQGQDPMLRLKRLRSRSWLAVLQHCLFQPKRFLSEQAQDLQTSKVRQIRKFFSWLH
jgi:hypothetical protein